MRLTLCDLSTSAVVCDQGLAICRGSTMMWQASPTHYSWGRGSACHPRGHRPHTGGWWVLRARAGRCSEAASSEQSQASNSKIRLERGVASGLLAGDGQCERGADVVQLHRFFRINGNHARGVRYPLYPHMFAHMLRVVCQGPHTRRGDNAAAVSSRSSSCGIHAHRQQRRLPARTHLAAAFSAFCALLSHHLSLFAVPRCSTVWP